MSEAADPDTTPQHTRQPSARRSSARMQQQQQQQQQHDAAPEPMQVDTDPADPPLPQQQQEQQPSASDEPIDTEMKQEEDAPAGAEPADQGPVKKEDEQVQDEDKEEDETSSSDLSDLSELTDLSDSSAEDEQDEHDQHGSHAGSDDDLPERAPTPGADDKEQASDKNKDPAFWHDPSGHTRNGRPIRRPVDIVPGMYVSEKAATKTKSTKKAGAAGGSASTSAQSDPSAKSSSGGNLKIRIRRRKTDAADTQAADPSAAASTPKKNKKNNKDWGLGVNNDSDQDESEDDEGSDGEYSGEDQGQEEEDPQDDMGDEDYGGKRAAKRPKLPPKASKQKADRSASSTSAASKSRPGLKRTAPAPDTSAEAQPATQHPAGAPAISTGPRSIKDEDSTYGVAMSAHAPNLIRKSRTFVRSAPGGTPSSSPSVKKERSDAAVSSGGEKSTEAAASSSTAPVASSSRMDLHTLAAESAKRERAKQKEKKKKSSVSNKPITSAETAGKVRDFIKALNKSIKAIMAVELEDRSSDQQTRLEYHSRVKEQQQSRLDAWERKERERAAEAQAEGEAGGDEAASISAAGAADSSRPEGKKRIHAKDKQRLDDSEEEGFEVSSQPFKTSGDSSSKIRTKAAGAAGISKNSGDPKGAAPTMTPKGKVKVGINAGATSTAEGGTANGRERTTAGLKGPAGSSTATATVSSQKRPGMSLAGAGPSTGGGKLSSSTAPRAAGESPEKDKSTVAASAVNAQMADWDVLFGTAPAAPSVSASQSQKTAATMPNIPKKGPSSATSAKKPGDAKKGGGVGAGGKGKGGADDGGSVVDVRFGSRSKQADSAEDLTEEQMAQRKAQAMAEYDDDSAGINLMSYQENIIILEEEIQRWNREGLFGESREWTRLGAVFARDSTLPVTDFFAVMDLDSKAARFAKVRELKAARERARVGEGSSTTAAAVVVAAEEVEGPKRRWAEDQYDADGRSKPSGAAWDTNAQDLGREGGTTGGWDQAADGVSGNGSGGAGWHGSQSKAARWGSRG